MAATVGAGLVVEPHDEGAIRREVDLAAPHDAIATVLAEETFPQAAGGIAAEIREMPPADEALTVLETMTQPTAMASPGLLVSGRLGTRSWCCRLI